MNKKLLIALPIALFAVAAIVAAYVMLTTSVTVHVKEGQEMSYYDWQQNDWVALPLDGSNYVFPDLDINAGDYYDIQYQATNPNKRDIMYTIALQSDNDNGTIEFVCGTSGLQYYVENDGTTNPTIYLINEAGATSEFNTRVVVNAGASPSETIIVTGSYDRAEVNQSINWQTCP